MTALRTGPVAIPLGWRSIAVNVLLAIAAAAIAVGSIAVAADTLDIGRVLAALTGSGDYYDWLVVTRFQLPRALAGLLIGVALGVAGAVFQSLSRNPLGSPDIAGFTAGASTGAVVQIIVFGSGAAGVALGSIGGGLVTAFLVYALAHRSGVQGYRLVLVGIGLNAILSALNRFLLSAAELSTAQQAQIWLIGSLNGRSWADLVPIAITLVVVLPLVLVLGQRMRLVEMGDDLATALGVPVERTRAYLLVLGTALAAVATATAGPISFIALAAPQIAKRIAGPGLVSAGVTGSLLLSVSDLASLWISPSGQLPVGVFTASVGGAYLAWLLLWASRRGRA